METLLIALAIAVIAALAAVQRHQRKSGPRAPTSKRAGGRAHPHRKSEPQRRPYPGDHTGRVHVAYAPSRDGRPDPGEIVWTWVPFEEDHSRGKDRPVLLVGRDDTWLLGIQLSSRDHYLDADQEARRGRHWLGIGAGPWDARRRPSAVRLDRIIRVDPAAVRREGAVLDRRTFEQVARSLSALHHW